MPTGTSFYAQELERALQENAFAIKSSKVLSQTGSVRAAASITLLEDQEIIVQLDNDGFRVSPKS